MVGSHILNTLRSSPLVSSIDMIARRNPQLNEPDKKLTTLVEPDLSKWTGYFRALSPVPQVYYCAFATTRGAVGGFDNQYKIEHDFNIEMAREAKQAGIKVFVLVSSAGADPNSRMGYQKIKGDIEEHVKELGFDYTVILRPGLIAGDREESRPAEAVIRKIADFAGSIHSSLKNFWAQDADVIAKAAVSAGLKALNGEAPDKIWIIAQSDIVHLGLTEWKSI
ncbi:putative protein fmp52 [Phaeomoniella chlamydospora]|uniref:NAD(P)-binding domain-containing protein n=1 Tax=Phaeomoniella chlamydospora TaxID=158046 RepID=A0A0G2DTR5_PHACM|nr:putative protein fmp52 [Phaeomoniella chlamydospora]